MKILVTGAEGFVGTNLTPKLKEIGEVYALTSDLRNFEATSEEILKYNPNIIVHLAARTEVETSFYDQLDFTTVNYLGTQNLIETAKELKNLDCILFSSTMEVYGWQPISDEVKLYSVPKKFIAFDEDTPVNPNAPYAVAKHACEKYFEYASRAYGIKYITFRQTNTYGRSNNDFFVTESIISQMLKKHRNKWRVMLGYSEPYRNFLYKDDLIDAWMSAISKRTKLYNNIYTIGPDNPIKMKDYAELIWKKVDYHGSLYWNMRPDRPGEIFYLNSSNSLFSKLTGWKPKTSLSDGLDKTIEIWNERIHSED